MTGSQLGTFCIRLNTRSVGRLGVRGEWISTLRWTVGTYSFDVRVNLKVVNVIQGVGFEKVVGGGCCCCSPARQACSGEHPHAKKEKHVA